MSRIRRRRSARRDGWTNTAEGWSGSATSQRGKHSVSPMIIRASVLGRLLGDPTAAPGGRHLSLPGGPRLVLHRRPIPPCRHEFRDHGRDRRSHRRGRAVSACISNPRRDTSPRHSKKAARIIAVRALSSAPACGVGRKRLRVHGCAPRGVNVLGPDLSAVGTVKQAGSVTSRP
jgi:hypothetical protein